jgi:hypothetical protein
VSLGTWGAWTSQGPVLVAMGRLDLAVRDKVSGSFSIGGQRWYDGSFAIRDGFLLAAVDVINEPDRVLRVKPGLTLPIGAVSSGLSVTPLTTGSFDPWLQVDALIGGTWLGGGTLTVRAPVSKGSDGVRQGVRGRVDLKGARRTAKGVGWAGATSVVQGGGELTADTSLELSLAGGWVHELNDNWVLGVDGRVPVFTRNLGAAHYVAMLGVTISRANQGQESEDAHHDGDGHDHGGGGDHHDEGEGEHGR